MEIFSVAFLSPSYASFPPLVPTLSYSFAFFYVRKHYMGELHRLCTKLNQSHKSYRTLQRYSPSRDIRPARRMYGYAQQMRSSPL
uniref:Uncharacterized protein n=1 Tax=Picea glauca TaxID=3330 RepID=A0A124GP16_PICGL|nr:hypothetical protein ABT39_MTgene397 [Picea glauca]QHR92194.1 hypothetical protein Q903MT_gene6231 [Picea sitchensis]